MSEAENANNDQNLHAKRSRSRVRVRSPIITVSVTDEQIDRAIRRDSRHCWIAEAIQEAYPDLSNVVVDLQAIRATESKRQLRFVWLSPAAVQIALISFDQGNRPEPFTFKLSRPSSVTRTITRPSTITDRTAYEREKEQTKREMTLGDNLEEPFEPPRAYREKVVKAMDTPNEPLGPAVFISPARGNNSSVPVQVGGNPPRLTKGPKGNIVRMRRFGVRILTA